MWMLPPPIPFLPHPAVPSLPPSPSPNKTSLDNSPPPPLSYCIFSLDVWAASLGFPPSCCSLQLSFLQLPLLS